jgi:uncharacterized protein YdeI (YjbR/CyaY-like superfamily)
MVIKDARIDAYIRKSAEFAKPILEYLRESVHKACPEVEETMKWSFPHFDYKGMLCSMASFKQHCAFGFWKSQLMEDPDNILKSLGEDAMGNFGALKSVQDLPPKKVIMKYVKQAMKLNDDGVKIKKKIRPKKNLVVPEDFENQLRKNKQASAVFRKFSPSLQREYFEWIAEAKREETRTNRIKTSIDWISEGKQRNWKYLKK